MISIIISEKQAEMLFTLVDDKVSCLLVQCMHARGLGDDESAEVFSKAMQDFGHVAAQLPGWRGPIPTLEE